MTDHRSGELVDRRTLLLGAGVIGLVACASGSGTSVDGTATTGPAEPAAEPVTADVPDRTDPPTPPIGQDPVAEDSVGAGPAVLTSADFDALAICTMLPSTAAGPFPNIDQLDRRDVTEGYPGHPLRLGLRVVDGACVPVPDAQVEIWHTDATGDYSSFEDGGSGKDEGEGTTFLRGFQTSGPDGITEFMSIYPGWYEGRAVHVHVLVQVGGVELLTTQLYFDEQYTEQVYATGVYAKFGSPDTSWQRDGLIGDPATDGSGLALRAADTTLGPGTVGLANIGLPV